MWFKLSSVSQPAGRSCSAVWTFGTNTEIIFCQPRQNQVPRPVQTNVVSNWSISNWIDSQTTAWRFAAQPLRESSVFITNKIQEKEAQVLYFVWRIVALWLSDMMHLQISKVKNSPAVHQSVLTDHRRVHPQQHNHRSSNDVFLW